LSTSQTIYVFRCGTSGLYALTADRSGKILPSAACCPAGWRLERSIALGPEEATRNRDLVRATLAAIANQGFYLSHAAIGALPLDMASKQVDGATTAALSV
jgi:hypothetical protein